MAKVWVTGVCGFLGSHLAEKLIADGHEVCGNDNLICGNVDNADCLWFKTECQEYAAMESVLESFKPDVLVHCAATAAEGFSVFSPSFITRNIYEASVATFSAAIAAGVKHIVTMSSMARYGHGYQDANGIDTGPPFEEDFHGTFPVDPYGIAKVAAEETLKVLCETHGVKWTILVPHNIIGTRQQVTPYRNVISIFLNRLHYDLPVYIYGDGNQKRCFSPVADCLHSLVRAVQGDAVGEVVNIGPDGGEITINEALELCERVTGKKAERVYLDPRPVTDEVKEAYCSSDKARRLLGYEPQQSLEDCVKEMWANFKPVPFDYSFPIEIDSPRLPRTWKEKL